MIGEITSVDLSALAPALQNAGPGRRTEFDIANFQDAYLRAGQAHKGTEAQSLGPPPSVADSEGFRAVLNTLNSLNGRADSLGTDAARTKTANEMTSGDMLMLTVRCHEFLFHCELTSNVANRTSDGVQQLFRQQS